MSLYYHKNTYEFKEISDELILAWEDNSNPKRNDWILVPEKPSNEAIWNNGSWTIPDAQVPQTVSARQIRLWLVQHGFQLSQIETAINNIEDPMTRETVRIEWEYAPYVERTHPWLESFAFSLGLTSEQIDEAFREANEI